MKDNFDNVFEVHFSWVLFGRLLTGRCFQYGLFKSIFVTLRFGTRAVQLFMSCVVVFRGRFYSFVTLIRSIQVSPLNTPQQFHVIFKSATTDGVI